MNMTARAEGALWKLDATALTQGYAEGIDGSRKMNSLSWAEPLNRKKTPRSLMSPRKSAQNHSADKADEIPSWPADSVERRKIASLIPHARNARTHSPEQVDQIARLGSHGSRR
jgi:hypothetical protein